MSNRPGLLLSKPTTDGKRKTPAGFTAGGRFIKSQIHSEVETNLRFELAVLSALGCNQAKGVRAVNVCTGRSGPGVIQDIGSIEADLHTPGLIDPKCLANVPIKGPRSGQFDCSLANSPP